MTESAAFPKINEEAMATPVQLIDSYLGGPAGLRQAVAGMSREQALGRLVPGRWSTLEVVCHLADFEPIFADRIKRLAPSKRSCSAPMSNASPRRCATMMRDLDEELTIIDKTAAARWTHLEKAACRVLALRGVHSERGPMTVSQLLESAVNHIHHHVKFIHEKRTAPGLS